MSEHFSLVSSNTMGLLKELIGGKKKSKNKTKKSQQLTQKSKEKGNKIFIITLALNSYSVL